MPPTLKDGTPIATQYLALAARNANGSAIGDGINEASRAVFNKYETVEVSKYFEDPEGVVDLIYSLADLSDDDKKIVTVSLAATAALDTDGSEDGDIDDPGEMPTSEKSVNGKAYLNISGKAAGSVTLMLTVKDGLPDGVTSQSIQVMVRDANAPPEIVSTALGADAIEKMSRTGAKRIPSNENTVVMIPMGAFTDANGDAFTLTAEVSGANADTITSNKALLDVEIAGGNLVLKPKKGSNNVNIPVVLKATDRYGASAMTGDDINTPAEAILVEINNPPSHKTYTDVASTVTDVTIPEGAKNGDKIMLAHLTDKQFSVAGDADEEDQAFITLNTFFEDLDGEDSITGNDRICAFDTSPADQKFAEITFNAGGTIVQVAAKMRGMFDLSVTCTDLIGEMVTDMVEVTIIQ
jgi:hypothetical protein